MSLELQTNDTTNVDKGDTDLECGPVPVPESDPELGVLYYMLAILDSMRKTQEELKKVEVSKQNCDNTLEKSQQLFQKVIMELEQSKNPEEPTHTSLNAAVVELQGKQVPAAYELGRIFDHVMKVHERVRALEKSRMSIEREINNFERLQQLCASREALELLNDGRLLRLQMMLSQLDSKIQYYRLLVPAGSQIDREHAQNLIHQHEEEQKLIKRLQQERQQAILAQQNSVKYRLQEALKHTFMKDAPKIAAATIFREMGLMLWNIRGYSTFSEAFERIHRQLLKQLSIGCAASFTAHLLRKQSTHPYLTALFTAVWTLSEGLGKGYSWRKLALKFATDLGSSMSIMGLARLCNKRVIVITTLISSIFQAGKIIINPQIARVEKVKAVAKVGMISAGTVAGVCAGEMIGSWVGGAIGTSLGPVGAVVGVAVGAFAGGVIAGGIEKLASWLFS